MKISTKAHQAFDFYTQMSKIFSFTGKEITCRYQEKAPTALQLFTLLESFSPQQLVAKGIDASNPVTCEPIALQQVLIGKIAYHLQITQWADGVAKMLVTIYELKQDFDLPDRVWLELQSAADKIWKTNKQIRKEVYKRYGV